MVAKNKKTRKRSWQTVFFSVLLGALLLIVVGSLLVSNWRMTQRRQELNSQLENLQEQLQALEIKRQQLQAQISQTSEESYLEKEARETFNLKKPGEEVVTILPAENEEGREQEKGFWGNIWDKIKFW